MGPQQPFRGPSVYTRRNDFLLTAAGLLRPKCVVPSNCLNPDLSSGRRRLLTVAVIALLVTLFLELTFTLRRETQTWDEACHIFAGYNYWTSANFGDNPEHPPLVKLLAAVPLLRLPLHVPAHAGVFSKEEDFLTSEKFVFGNDAETILFRTRMAAALLTLLLAILIFVAGKEMFGEIPALVALTLFVFEPNMLAHGAVVTTDMGMACFLLATVYAFYRYVKAPSMGRVAVVGIAAGLALATKHSAILIFPILGLLSVYELVRRRASDAESRGKQAARLFVAICAIGIVSVAILWSFYGFHFQPKPGMNADARVTEYVTRLKNPVQSTMILAASHLHLLPQSYLFGLADVGITAEFSHSYLLGKIYPHGRWFYFPVAFSIKTSLGLLLLLALAAFAFWRSRVREWRELVFLLVPAVFYFLIAVASSMNIGIRHILPVYPFLMLLAGWGAWQLIKTQRRWVYVIILLLIWNVVSSLRTYPVYIAYSNELWGGPSQTYRYLSDSNVDWGQQLKTTKKYLDSRHIQNCWFAYFGAVVIDPSYYGVNCKPLTTIASVWLQPSIDVPASIDGPVLISAGVLSGYEFGPGELNPYDQFQHIRPTAVIEHGIFVFDGHFDIPLASALNHVTRSQLASRANRLDEALSEAQTAVAIAPRCVQAQAELGDVLARFEKRDESRRAFQTAWDAAQSTYPEFRSTWTLAQIKAGLQSR